MAKGMGIQKAGKKEATKTLKEKRAEKKAKKDSKKGSQFFFRKNESTPEWGAFFC